MCGDVSGQRLPKIFQAGGRVVGLACLLLVGRVGPVAADAIWLDFADFDASLYGLGGQESSLKVDITAGVANDYAAWSAFDIRYDFDSSTPGDQAPTGTYSHIDIGGGDGDSSRLIFGIADDIDWRNQNPSDGALIYSDEFYNWDNTYFNDYTRLTNTLTGTITHETGHILGLSHHDSFGPVGTSTTPGYSDNPFTGGGADTNKHIMATGSTGLSKAQRAVDRSFGEREGWKLDAATGKIGLFPEAGSHATRATAQVIGGAENVGVIAAITSGTEEDWYAFSGRAGTYVDIEIYSRRPNRFSNAIDPLFDLYDSTGSLLLSRDDYWAYSTGLDTALLDYALPETGTYYLAVGSFGSSDTGDYELYMHSPEPGTLLIVVVGLIALVIWRRRVAGRTADGSG